MNRESHHWSNKINKEILIITGNSKRWRARIPILLHIYNFMSCYSSRGNLILHDNIFHAAKSFFQMITACWWNSLVQHHLFQFTKSFCTRGGMRADWSSWIQLLLLSVGERLWLWTSSKNGKQQWGSCRQPEHWGVGGGGLPYEKVGDARCAA